MRYLLFETIVRQEGQTQPEMEMKLRLQWPEDHTMDQIIEDYLLTVCQQLHGHKAKVIEAV